MGFDMLMLRLSILLPYFINSIPASDDPCSSYGEIDEWRRSANYRKDSNPLCDTTIKEGWYRFTSKAGGEMPRSAPAYQHCGTTYPIWHNGEIPGKGVELETKGCVVAIFTNCSSEYQIKVKNCSDYVIYYLPQTDGCSQAYCAGTNVPCLAGESSLNGFSPGCKAVPDVEMNIAISAHLVNGSKASSEVIHTVLEFRCGFDEPEDSRNYKYQVAWYIENNIIYSSDFVPFDEMSKTHLQEKHFNDHRFGYNLKCGVRINFPSNNAIGQYKYGEMYVGFQTDRQRYSVKENETVNINIHLTVPFGCTSYLNNIEEICKFSIRGQVPSVPETDTCRPDTVNFDNTCEVTFHYKNWRETKSLEVFGTVDNLINAADRLTYVRLQAENYIAHTTWNYAKNKDIEILIEDKDNTFSGKICTVKTDPNIATFDGKCYRYQGAGEFIIYKHSTRPFSVHAMFTTCAAAGSCTCGIAVRNGKDVFVANYCHDITTHYVSGRKKTNNYLKAHTCDDTHMLIEKRGERNYKVVLPSGTNVTMEFGEWGGDTFAKWVTIYPSMADFGNTMGLCGIFDGIKENDFHHRDKTTANKKDFIEHWRVIEHSKESLFSNSYELDTQNSELRRYCKCSEDNQETMKCSNDLTIDEKCASKHLGARVYTTCASNRKKRSTKFRRSIEIEITIDEYPLVYHDDYKDEPPVAHWTNGWNEEKAKSYCENKLKNTQAARLCGQVLSYFNETIENAIEECVSDIKNSGSTEMADATSSGLVDECRTDALKIENLTSTASNSGNASKSLLDDILDTTCQNNCSNAGKCLKGICACEDGYGGMDCSRQIRMPPEVFQPSAAANCKTDQKRCLDFTIPGRSFLEYNLTCRARSFKIKRTGIHTSNEVIEFPGTYIADFACVCTVPFQRKRRSIRADEVMAEGYNISVSNDGKNFSEDVTFITFDSLCFNCSLDELNCTEVDTCPDQSQKTTNNDDEDKTVPLIIALAFLGGIIVIVIVALVVHKWHNKKVRVTTTLVQGINLSCKQRMQSYDDDAPFWRKEKF